ncbi:MAG: MmgE/PrpD family protein [Candidatus Binatia bacterium]
MTANSDITHSLAAYIASARDLPLADEVVLQAKHHILDTFAAMISGSRLKPSEVIRRYVQSEGGLDQAQVVGGSLLTSATLAALANGTAAHADETDDSHAASGTHPGCAVVPAALALAEKSACDGTAFLKAVVAGYDIGCRVGRSLNPASLSTTGHSSRSLGNIFGACAAAASVAQLSADLIGCALAYSAQQAAGIGSYIRAKEHIEKALVLGGLPARNGVTAVELARAGASGAADPFHGERSFLQAYARDPRAPELTNGLGDHFEITQTSIKKYCVGSPIQAPVEALFDMMSEYPLSAEDIERMTVRIPEHRAGTVNNRKMADVNLQHILALALIRGKLTFAAVHNDDASEDPAIRSIKSRIQLIPDPALLESVSPRQVSLEVVTRDGKTLTRHLLTYRGTPENPASTQEVEEKARDLMVPVIGKARTEQLIQCIENLAQVKDMRELRPNFVAMEQDSISNEQGGRL